MAYVKTIQVLRSGQLCLINEQDFDPEVHVLPGDASTETELSHETDTDKKSSRLNSNGKRTTKAPAKRRATSKK